MLKISDQELKLAAKDKGYRPEMLEKVYRLLDLLAEFMAVPFLADRLVLKGGTAINLFCADYFPRLSVDLDFNYIGSTDLTVMQSERPEIERIIIDICKRKQYTLQRNPSAHAGGKMVLVYQSLMGMKGRLEIDLNYMFRVPLWDTHWQFSPDWPSKVRAHLLDVHELAAGKLHALLGRDASRDLYDSHQLLTKWSLNEQKMRLGFTVYAAMEGRDWQQITAYNVRFSINDIRDKLIPVLKSSEVPGTSFKAIEKWANTLVEECKTSMALVLPFKEHEIEFLRHVQEEKEIRPELITDDNFMCERILQHPLLKWRINQFGK
ncbi:MAG: nucleotidyl transferase AbiEii/AbiGii toxin family protein [Gammaproteobacteria bacterium]|nr:nucleotidyl transferase AbiEii/AbiGii toxin family protein [Gammaproteobacteria bacterium]